MYNCWNESLEYLIKKCGEQLIPTGAHYQGQKDMSRMARTYNSSNIKEEDKVIVLLMNQYYYGIAAKKELYSIMQEKGLVL